MSGRFTTHDVPRREVQLELELRLRVVPRVSLQSRVSLHPQFVSLVRRGGSAVSNVPREFLGWSRNSKLLLLSRVHLEAGNSMNDTEVNETISQMVRYVVCLGAS